MKVDMSPKAVKERLKTVDELWLLSVKLINSKKLKSAKSGEENSRRLEEFSNSRKDKQG